MKWPKGKTTLIFNVWALKLGFCTETESRLNKFVPLRWTGQHSENGNYGRKYCPGNSGCAERWNVVTNNLPVF